VSAHGSTAPMRAGCSCRAHARIKSLLLAHGRKEQWWEWRQWWWRWRRWRCWQSVVAVMAVVAVVAVLAVSGCGYGSAGGGGSQWRVAVARAVRTGVEGMRQPLPAEAAASASFSASSPSCCRRIASTITSISRSCDSACAAIICERALGWCA
jgi:hypothetical protein